LLLPKGVMGLFARPERRPGAVVEPEVTPAAREVTG
jgi:hypothetical protein